MLDFLHQLLVPLATATATLGLFHLIAEVHIRLSEADGEPTGQLPRDVWE